MEADTLDISQRKAARIAGFTLIFAVILVIVANYSVNFRLIIPNSAAETAQNIIENNTLFRFNIFCNLLYITTLIVMFTSLYVVLEPVNKNLALSAAFFRLIYALMWGIMAVNTCDALHLLGDAPYLPAFDPDQLKAMTMLNLVTGWNAYYVGLPFWGLASTACSYLLFKSKYIPKALAVFGIVSSAWCVFCAFAYIIYPDYGKVVHIGLFDTPLTIFEVTLGFWLLFKELRPSEIGRSNFAIQEKS